MSAVKAILCCRNFIRIFDRFFIKFGPVPRELFKHRESGDVLTEASYTIHIFVVALSSLNTGNEECSELSSLAWVLLLVR